MVQYYTLDEAARMLRTTPEKLKESAKKGEVRAFQDRGTLRFRTQEIDELVRLKGLGSDPELQLGEVLAPNPPTAGKHTAHAPGPPVFDFTLEAGDEVPIGQEPASPSSSRGKSPAPKSAGPKTPSGRPAGPRSPAPRSPTPKSPPPKASGDSDVRLVLDGSDLDFQIAPEGSEAQVPKSASPSPSGSSKKGKPTAETDSGVRIVPLDQASDSDVKIVPASPEDSDLPIASTGAKTPSDSDIRLEPHSMAAPPTGQHSKGSDPAMVTEDIDLDAETRKAEQAARAKAKSKVRGKPKAPELPQSSPFELSDSDLELKPPTPGPKTPEVAKKADTDSSSDFELTPMSANESPLEISSDEIPALPGDEEVSLGEVAGATGDSGINLKDPADSGISLEQSGEIDFELSLDAGATPKPTSGDEKPDSSSEFELSLHDEDASPLGDDSSSSEFELSLDAGEEVKAEPDSDSEFELTLDSTGDLASIDDSSSLGGEHERDIFETDLEMPSLDSGDSGSEAVALDEDTDLESSDFDLEMDEGESADEGSQVVNLDEENADEGAATVARPRRGARQRAGVIEEGEEDLDRELDEEEPGEPEAEEEELAGPTPTVVEAAPAEWGAFPGVVLLLCMPVLFLVGLMSYELIQSMHGYHKPGAIVHTIGEWVSGSKLPD
jgi:hypothetical protein